MKENENKKLNIVEILKDAPKGKVFPPISDINSLKI